MKLSEETKTVLKEYGWSLNREINISEYVRFLVAEGYEVSDKAKEFLINFGGLHLKMPEFSTSKWTKLHFDPIITAENIFRENIEGYEKRIGETLTPVGEAYNGYYVLMISKTGKMFGAFENTLRQEGNDYEEGIESLYKRLETPEIPN